MPGKLKRWLLIFVCALALPAFATTRYVAQSAGTFTGGTVCNGQTAITVATFNATTLAAGDVTWVCGTITGAAGANGINFKNGGSSGNPVVLNFDTGSSLQAPYWGSDPFSGTAGAVISTVSNVVINGQGVGIVENTLNGSSGATCPGGACTGQHASNGVYVSGNNVTVENLIVGPMYVHTQDDSASAAEHNVGIYYLLGSGGNTGAVTGNTVTQAYQTVALGYNGTNSVNGFTFSNNTLNHACHFLQIGDDNGGSSASGYAIFGNTMGPNQIDWTQASQGCHFDGIIMSAFNSGSVASNTLIYNNVIQSDMCSGVDSNYNCTGWIFFTGDFSGMNIFNNVLVATGTNQGYESMIRPAPNSYSGAVQTNVRIANNTLLMGNSTASCDCAGIKEDGSTTGTTGFQSINNIIEHFSSSSNKAYLQENQSFDTVYGASANINNNVYYDTGTFGRDTSFSNCTFSTFSTWQALTSCNSFPGYDANGGVGNPLLNASYVPQSGSSAIGAGQNLTSLCSGALVPLCSDAAGNARPSSGNWTAGAFNQATGQASSASCSPGSGTYSGTQTVTCTNPNSGTTVMCYTVNGATPATNGAGTGCATGTAYSTTISVSTSKTLQVIAGTNTLTDSSIVSFSYLIPISTTYVNASTGNDTYDCSSATFVSAYQGPCLTPNRGAAAATASGTINIAAGTYRLSTALNSAAGYITAKNSQTFVGPSCTPTTAACTAIISGSIVLCTVTYPCSGPDGNGNWSVTGMIQHGTVSSGTCDPGWSGCIYPEDLFVNGAPLQHINSSTLPTLTSTQWWFDYTNQIIYFHTNPSGQTVETGVLETMFQPNGANGITLNNLTVEEFAAPLLLGAIDPVFGNVTNASSLNWTIENSYITLNHGYGVRCAFGEHVLNSVLTANGDLGTGGGCTTTASVIPSGVVIQGNTITFNNYAHVSPGFGAGGIKYGNTASPTIRGNIVTDNIGNGIHCDDNSIACLIDGNTVERNIDSAATGGSGYGIICEISQACTFRNNYIQFEGTGGAVGMYSSTSTNVQAYCNVDEQTSGTNSIWAVGAANRGNRLLQPGLGTQNVSTGNDFLYNTVIWDSGTTGTVGFFQNDTANQPNFFANNTAPDFNTYHNASTSITKFIYDNNNSGSNTPVNFTTYQGNGADVHGTLDTVYTSGFPAVAITSPADQSVELAPVSIAATASDGSGIANVKFYVDWTLVSTQTSGPFSYSWTPSAGSHVIAALAKSNAGVQNCNAITLTGGPTPVTPSPSVGLPAVVN